MQVCKSKKISIFPHILVASILIVGLPLSMGSNCDQPICFLTPNENSNYYETEAAMNWYFSYFTIFIGILIACCGIDKVTKESSDLAFQAFLLLMACLICIGMPVMHNNIGECDAPLCYLDGPSNDRDIHANNAANYQAFYVLTFFQIILTHTTFALILPDSIVKNRGKYFRSILIGSIAVLFCVVAPVMNNNIGTCDMPLCYFGESSSENSTKQAQYENLNTMAFFFVLGLQIIFGYLFFRSLCELNDEPAEKITT